MLSIALTAQNLKLLGFVIDGQNFVFEGLGFVVMKASAILATIAIYFLIYWVLPHGKVPGASGAASSSYHRLGVGGGEIYLHPATAVA